MRGISNKAALLDERAFQAFYHLVKDHRQFMDFVPCQRDCDTLMKIFGSNRASHARQTRNGLKSSPRQPVAYEGAQQKDKWSKQNNSEANLSHGSMKTGKRNTNLDDTNNLFRINEHGTINTDRLPAIR